MNDPSNRRHYPRVNVSDDHTVRYRLGEKSTSGLTMINLSAGGCCIKVPMGETEGLEKGTLVNLLYLVHPRIPSVPLQATICWLMGKQSGRTEGFILVGLEFLNPSPKFQDTLDAYVTELLA